MKYQAVIFDLLSALLDSWSLWDEIAGSPEAGRRWRKAYLELTYATGAYRPYEVLVAEAAEREGYPAVWSEELARRYSELKPWPEAHEVLGRLAAKVPLAIVTNCSNPLAKVAVGQIGVPFEVIVTAEEVGFYKPDPRTYWAALKALGLEPGQALFVAGSAFDLVGTARVGIPTYWHNRVGLSLPPDTAPPLTTQTSLEPLLEFAGVNA
ncbi:MAG: HAD-IA family hydrolase [Meiothermus sp.]|nr:HAD-IA family hydrolase [Meiothermus sp.]